MTLIAHACNVLVAITQNQFDTPPPLHCFDADLQNPADLKLLSLDVPTIDSHIKQLLRGKGFEYETARARLTWAAYSCSVSAQASRFETPLSMSGC